MQILTHFNFEFEKGYKRITSGCVNFLFRCSQVDGFCMEIIKFFEYHYVECFQGIILKFML